MNKHDLLNMYKQGIANEERIKDLKHQNEVLILKYRIESVLRILNLMNREGKDNMVVHCLNKLNGNIDGIEIGLEEDK